MSRERGSNPGLAISQQLSDTGEVFHFADPLFPKMRLLMPAREGRCWKYWDRAHGVPHTGQTVTDARLNSPLLFPYSLGSKGFKQIRKAINSFL